MFSTQKGRIFIENIDRKCKELTSYVFQDNVLQIFEKNPVGPRLSA